MNSLAAAMTGRGPRPAAPNACAACPGRLEAAEAGARLAQRLGWRWARARARAQGQAQARARATGYSTLRKGSAGLQLRGIGQLLREGTQRRAAHALSHTRLA